MHWDIFSSVTSEACISASQNQTMMWRKRFFLLLFSLSTLKAELDCEKMEKTNGLTSPILSSETNVVMKGQNVSIICSSQNKLPPITYSLFRHKKCIGTQNSKDPVATPVLNITRKASHYVTLHCLSSYGSLPINYTFFENNIPISRVIIKNVREPAEFNLTKNPAGGEEYKCKAKNRLPDQVKYSLPVTVTVTVTTPSAGGGSCPLCLQLLLPALLLVLFVTILILAFRTLSKYKARKSLRDKAPKDYGHTPMEVGLYANICENQADKESAPGLEPRQYVSTAQDGKHSLQSPEATHHCEGSELSHCPQMIRHSADEPNNSVLVFCPETKSSQEIHYATPLFQKVTPQNHEAYNNGKTEYVYSEIIL
ncbi:allergin-1 isoform 2-T2 [Glossophaga mutica]